MAMPMTLSLRRAVLVVLIASVAVVGGALLFQYAGGLAPCELCLYERWPYYIAIVLALATLAAARSHEAAMGGGALLALVFIASSALAFYHVGVEQHWFAGPTACTGSGAAAASIDQLRAQLMAQQPVQCDQPQWSLGGITLAGWNLAASLALTVLSCAAVRLAMKERLP
jgi:disulfide bond formation protein DsbB